MKTIIRQIRKLDRKLITSIFLVAQGQLHSANNRFFANNRDILLIAFQNNIPCGFLFAYVLDSLNSRQPKLFLYSTDVFDIFKKRNIGTRLKETIINMKVIGTNIALMAVFCAVGLTLFTENVRTVQIVGLFACGVVFGVSLAAIISAFRSRQTRV